MAARAHLLIRKGRVIDPLSGRDEVADLLVEDGRLVRIGASLDAPPLVKTSVPLKGPLCAHSPEGSSVPPKPTRAGATAVVGCDCSTWRCPGP